MMANCFHGNSVMRQMECRQAKKMSVAPGCKTNKTLKEVFLEGKEPFAEMKLSVRDDPLAQRSDLRQSRPFQCIHFLPLYLLGAFLHIPSDTL